MKVSVQQGASCTWVAKRSPQQVEQTARIEVVGQDEIDKGNLPIMDHMEPHGPC